MPLGKNSVIAISLQLSVSSSALAANSLQFDMVSGELVVVGACELVDEPFKTWGTLQVNKLPALETDKVVVMGFEGFCELVALLEADLNDIDYAKFREELEGPVNARALRELACFEDFL